MNTPIFTSLIAAVMAGALQCAASSDGQHRALEAFAAYDSIMRNHTGGPFQPADSIALSRNLTDALDGFREWRRQAPGEPVPDTLAEAVGRHYNDFSLFGIFMYQNQDFRGAYDMWEGCVDLPDDPAISRAVVNPANPREIIAANRAVAARQAGMTSEALALYRKAISLGYDDKGVFDSAIALAQSSGDRTVMLEWFRMGVEKYGRNSLYREYEIKYTIEDDPLQGYELASQSIAEFPDNPKWYNMRVSAAERLQRHESVLADLRRVTELTPGDPQVWYNYGNKLFRMAEMARNDADLSIEELNERFLRAADVFEQVIALSKGDKFKRHLVVNSLNYLHYSYDCTQNKEGLKRWKQYKKQFNFK